MMNDIFVANKPIIFYLFRHDFIEIMDMIDKRLNDKGKNWRHVFKVRFKKRT